MLRIGTLTPSSNIVVEPVTAAMLGDVDGVTAHFARFGYAGSTAQLADDYDWPQMLEAARLLADAKVHCICWNGSRGGTLGFARDRLLCERIIAAHQVPATTSTLALDELLSGARIRRIAFVTPYAESMNAKIADVWRAEGYDVVAMQAGGLTDNFSYASVSADALMMMTRNVARARPSAIIFYCTNMRAAELCVPLEAELGVPVLDAVSAGVWKCLDIIGVPKTLALGWGRLLK